MILNQALKSKLLDILTKQFFRIALTTMISY